MDEKSLIGALQNGDMGAFEILVKLHHRAVYAMVFRYMQDHGATDDVVQDTFMKAYHAIGSFRQESSFKSWVIRIGINTAKNALRSRDSRQMVDVNEVNLEFEHSDYKRLERSQTSRLLKVAIERLPARQRQALELRIFEDLSFKEVSEIMECPFDTAKANFRHGLLNLKKILESADSGKGIDELKLAFATLAKEDEGYEP